MVRPVCKVVLHFKKAWRPCECDSTPAQRLRLGPRKGGTSAVAWTGMLEMLCGAKGGGEGV
jgi:hypothetical protein